MTRLNRRRFAAGLGAAAGFAAGLALPRRSAARAQDPQAADPPAGQASANGRTTTIVYKESDAGPGPSIRVRRGEEVAIRLVNALDRPASVHWHGVRIANAMDGASGLTQAPIPVGGTFDYRFTPADAGTYWYHPDAGGDAAPRSAALHGLLVVDDPHADPVDRDIALMVDAAPSQGKAPAVSVNGKPAEEISLRRNERVLLRIVNVSRSWLAELAFGGIEATIVAIDGRPVNEAFAPAGRRLDLAPGCRADVIVDGTMEKEGQAGIAVLAGGSIVVIVRFGLAPGESARAVPLPPAKAATATGLPADIALAAAKRVELSLDAAAAGDGALFSVKQGTPVTLALVNQSQLDRVVHPHGHAVRVLHALDDGWQPFWLDTILVPAGETVHLAFVADNPGKWAIDEAALGGEGATRRGYFEVVPA